MARRNSGFAAALSFLTIIPVNTKESTDTVAFFASVGFIEGLITAILFYFTYVFIGPIPASAAAISALMIVSGFTHIDAVLDTGDALMTRGSEERRREVIKDKYLGSGGIASFFIIYVVLFSVLPEMGSFKGSISLIAIETASKFLMAYSLHNSKIFSEGYASHFRDQLDSRFARNTIINIIPVIILMLVSFPLTVIPIIFSFLIIWAVKRRISYLMGGINGDVLGFMGELFRTIAAVGILLEIKLCPALSSTMVNIFFVHL